MNRQNITSEESAMCRQFGITPEEYLKTKRQDGEAEAGERWLSTQQQGPTSEESALCRQFGNTPEECLATRETDLVAAACQENAPLDEETKRKVLEVMGLSPQEAVKRENQIAIEAEAKQLTAEEIEVCQALGIDPVLEYLPQKMKDAGLKPKLMA
ncbi:MAG: hypothetical protein OET90_02015 [Desulfuromonadales bacterium]|nr:hypothetical protein [Desulfuromonadales bacterium]